MVKEEFQYYLANQAELVKKYNGKILVIKNKQVIGVYDNVSDAYEKTTKDHEVGTFLIQKCTPGDKDYSQTFHSRAIFA
jgi:hypothetical protein